MVHYSSSDELEELAAAFALEALSREERDDYLVHSARCILCQGLVGQYQTVAELLPHALDEQSVSVGLKERLLNQASADIETVERTATPPKAETRLPNWWRWPAWPVPGPAWVSAILMLVVIGLVAWNVNLQLKLNQQAELPSEQRELVELIAEGAKVSLLSGTEASPASSGRMVQVPGSKTALLLVSNLAPLPLDQEYQVWRIEGDVPVSAGTFRTAGYTAQLVRLSADFSAADAIGVSIEPSGGSISPTGDIVLLGTP